MRDPFRIEGPAVVSFSGGRTSGYMLHRILQAHGGTLPPDVLVSFQNTGKEMPETLDFIEECSQRWKVPVVWLEFSGFVPPGRANPIVRVVDYATASRDGEPFEALIDALQLLPNPVARTCTAFMKIKTLRSYLRGIGWDDWSIALGLRGDEPVRVARMRAPGRDNTGGEPLVPLADAGMTVREVSAFWKSQPFDLRLPNMNGKTMHSNCDLCFLKGPKQVLSLIREQPHRALWWMKQEQRIARASGDRGGATFRADRPSYAEMFRMATNHGELFPFDDEETAIDCACTD